MLHFWQFQSLRWFTFFGLNKSSFYKMIRAEVPSEYFNRSWFTHKDNNWRYVPSQKMILLFLLLIKSNKIFFLNLDTKTSHQPVLAAAGFCRPVVRTLRSCGSPSWPDCWVWRFLVWGYHSEPPCSRRTPSCRSGRTGWRRPSPSRRCNGTWWRPRSGPAIRLINDQHQIH